MKSQRTFKMSFINLHNFDKALLEMIKSYKYKGMVKEVEGLEETLQKKCMDLLGTIHFSDDRKDSNLSPVTTKLAERSNNVVENFELKVSQTLKPEISHSPSQEYFKNHNTSLLETIKSALDKASQKIKFQGKFTKRNFNYLLIH